MAVGKAPLELTRKTAKTALERYAATVVVDWKKVYKVRAFNDRGECVLEIMERPITTVRGRRIAARGKTWSGAWLNMRAELYRRTA